MQCQVSALNSGHLVSVAGEIDMASAPTLAETLVQFPNGNVTVDLAAVTFIDASGLKALVAAQRHIGRRHGRLLVQGVNPFTRKLFEMIGLGAVLSTNGVGNASRSEH
jgi:anti-anti-sigma factor